MEFQTVIRRRRMVRSFDGRPLARETVERLVANAVRVPSAGFAQANELLVLEGPEETARYWDASLPAAARAEFPWPGLLLAPLLVVVLASEDAYRGRYAEADKADRADFDVPWWFVDAGCSVLALLLTAVDAGLAALFFRAHRPGALRRAFDVPGSFVPVGTVAVGHAAADRQSTSAGRPRRSASAIVHRGRW
jgi:nitroreductase